jgi:GH18 family chitinase
MEATMDAMTKKQPKRGRGRPKGPERVALYVEILPDLKEQLEAAAAEDRRSLTTVVIIALEEFLARRVQEGGAK